MTETKTETKTIDVGTVENATELVFSCSQSDPSHRYVLEAVPSDYLAFITKYPNAKRTDRYYIDDSDGQWYACYNVDCFDPPFAIVRARSFETAYEVFCDEFSDWLKVEEPDANDYPEDDREYNSSGVHIDASAVQLYPLTLRSVSVG